MKELLAAYALGAVPAEEVPAVRAHILSCEECMQEADDFDSATSALAMSAGRSPVPAGFADRVVELARADREPVPETAPTRRRFLPYFLVAASLAVAAILGFQVYETQQQLNRQEQILGALLQQDGIELTGTSGAAARLVPRGQDALFAVAGLGKAPPGQTYQLWLLKEGADPVSGGVFDVSGGTAVIEVDAALEDYEAAAVTIEQAGGSDEGPTTDPILQG